MSARDAPPGPDAPPPPASNQGRGQMSAGKLDDLDGTATAPRSDADRYPTRPLTNITARYINGRKGIGANCTSCGRHKA